MDSKHFKEGSLVDITTPKSHLPDRNVTILEVHPQGIVGTQKGIKDAPIKFYSFEKIDQLELTRENSVVGITRTSGKAK